MLEFAAIDLDHGSRISNETLGCRLYNPSLSGTSRPEKKKIPNGPPGRIHARQMHLIDIDNLSDSLLLTYYQLA
jgi:hypothetical protein